MLDCSCRVPNDDSPSKNVGWISERALSPAESDPSFEGAGNGSLDSFVILLCEIFSVINSGQERS
jgi:hypothetical protein